MCLLSVTTQITEVTGPILTKISEVMMDLKGWNEFMCSTSFPHFLKRKLVGFLNELQFLMINQISYIIQI